MVVRTGGLLASRRLMDSVVFDLCRGPDTIAQVVCSSSRASIERSSERPKKHSKAAPYAQSFLPGFASGFLSKKSGCTGLGASSSSPRRRERQASPPDVVARPRVSVADRPPGKNPRQGDG
jgi:hypothetical protein